MIEIRRLGRSALDVPVVGMGTWSTFDVRGDRDEAQARAVIDCALENGCTVRLIADVWRSRAVLGAALEGREGALIATKVWTPSAEEGRRQAARALRFFGGRIDLY
ncbi:MAG: hypothetical protein H0W08_12555 [Acidobacteria bacterium]|nr:hypothetical protein [Acidobacteriota bacterium]